MAIDEAIRRRLKTIVILGVVLVVALIAFSIFQVRRNQPNSDEFVSPDSLAAIVYKNAAYLTGNTTVDIMLRQDIAYFARKNLSTYDPAKQPNVIFEVSKKTDISSDTTELIGKYREAKDDIKFTFTRLRNDRLKTSLTDKTTNTNSVMDLPSNSARNQFIATLPVTTRTYSINYLSGDDIFMITLYDGKPSSKTTALAVLQAGLKENSLESVGYRIVVPSSGGEGAGSPAL